MLYYQCNVLLSISVAVISAFFLAHYVRINHESIFFWRQEKCQQGFSCVDMYMKGPPRPHDPELIQHLRDNFLTPPPSSPSNEGFDIVLPVWRKLVDWNKVQEGLIDAFQAQPPGTFVEVGAVDGDFMSQTLFLEKNLSWTGLLIEPDPRSFEVLKNAGRNAWLSPLCVYYNFPSVRRFWLRTLEEDLPHHFIQLLMARSKLNDETLSGDEERGSTIWVPCVPLSTILLALDMKKVDLIAIATGGDADEKRIKDAIKSKLIDVKTLLIHYPTSRLYNEPYPRIPGYLIDAGRSQMMVKFYVKESYCQLVSNSSCKAIHHFDVAESCHTYLCFNHLTVRTFNPDIVIKT